MDEFIKRHDSKPFELGPTAITRGEDAKILL